ncbi:MAG: MFS transporter [Chloroflexi bacterium]|nr:MFS transporter [Chloroflexota bacterium]
MEVQQTRTGRVAIFSDSAPLWNLSFVALLVVWFLLGLLSAPTRPLLPVYVDGVLHRQPIFTSILNALFLITGAIGAIIGGPFADKVGRKTALLAGSITGPLAAAIFLTHSVLLLIVLSLLAGVLQSVQTIGGQTYMMSAVRQSHLSTASALFFIGSTLGTSLGNGLTSLVLTSWGWSVIAILMILCSLLVVAAALWTLPTLTDTFQPERRSVQSGTSYLFLLRRPEIILMMGIRVFPTVYWGMATILLPLLLFRLSHSAATAARYSAVSLLLAAACQLVTGHLADRVGRRWPAVIFTGAIAIEALLTALVTHQFTLLFITGILGACTAWSISVLVPGLVKEVSVPGAEGRTLALTILFWNVAMLSGGLLGGSLVSRHSAAPFFLAAIVNAAGFAMALALALRSNTPAKSDPAGAVAQLPS